MRFRKDKRFVVEDMGGRGLEIKSLILGFMFFNRSVLLFFVVLFYR